MIDFATPVRKNRVLDPLQNSDCKRVDSPLSRIQANTKLDFPESARRMVASSPAASVALAFVFGGIVAWLTSRR